MDDPAVLTLGSGVGKDRLPGEDDRVPGDGEPDPKLDRVSGEGTSVCKGMDCKDMGPPPLLGPQAGSSLEL